MRSSPLAAVVIATYQRSGLVRAAVESCLRQTVSDVEVLVIDDGSTDDTADRIAEIGDARVRYEWQANQRQGAARDLGVARSTAPVVLFLDSDDRLLPGAVEAVLATLERDPTAGLVYSDVRLVNSSGLTVSHSRARIEGDVIERLVLDNFIHLSASAVPRTVLQETGGFRRERDLAGSEDWELWIRIAARHAVRASHALGAERTVDTSSMLADPDNMVRSMRWALDLAFSDPVVRLRAGRLERRARAMIAVHAAGGYATARRRRASLSWAIRALRLWPGAITSPLLAYSVARALLGIGTFRGRRA